MTTTVEHAKNIAGALDDARSNLPWRYGTEVTTYWFDGDMLDEGSAWIKANADILPYGIDASWRQMDNGPLLTLRARGVQDVVTLLASAYALSERFGVGVSTHQPAGLDTIGVSVERISMDGYRANALRIDFSGSARLAVRADDDCPGSRRAAGHLIELGVSA